MTLSHCRCGNLSEGFWDSPSCSSIWADFSSNCSALRSLRDFYACYQKRISDSENRVEFAGILRALSILLRPKCRDMWVSLWGVGRSRVGPGSPDLEGVGCVIYF